MDWSDVRIFLAIAREKTLGAAARKVGQTQPTMGRRLRALERSVGHTLFQRTAEGFVLTDEGQLMLLHALRMEEEALAIGRALTGSGELTGLLRISSSDWFGVHVLTPVLAEFNRRHPSVILELLTDTRLYSLARREADLALRITPFEDPDIVSRRLLRIHYSAYIRQGSPHPRPGEGEDCSLVVMDTSFGSLPDVTWLMRALPGAKIAARSNNREIQARLCALGAGIAVLPMPLGETTPGLERVDLGSEPPVRDTWLGYHRDMRQARRLRAMVDLLVERLAD